MDGENWTNLGNLTRLLAILGSFVHFCCLRPDRGWKLVPKKRTPVNLLGWGLVHVFVNLLMAVSSTRDLAGTEPTVGTDGSRNRFGGSL